jgi:hypothetical protein
VFATQTCCWICGYEVDKTLPYKDPRTGLVNRLSKSLDHVIPCLMRPDLALNPANAKLAHLGHVHDHQAVARAERDHVTRLPARVRSAERPEVVPGFAEKRYSGMELLPGAGRRPGA